MYIHVDPNWSMLIHFEGGGGVPCGAYNRTEPWRSLLERRYNKGRGKKKVGIFQLFELLPLLNSYWYWQNSKPIQTKKLLKFRPNSQQILIIFTKNSDLQRLPIWYFIIITLKMETHKHRKLLEIVGSSKVRWRWHHCEYTYETPIKSTII